MEDLSGEFEDGGLIRSAGSSELVHLAYELALDPERLPEFAQLWREHLALVRSGLRASCDPDLREHLRRACRILDRLPRIPGAGSEAVLAGIQRVPAFLSDGIVRIGACNRAAESAFRISAGAPLAALPFDAGDVVMLSSTIRRVSRRADTARNLRVRSVLSGATVVLRVCVPDSREDRAQALVLATEPVWPEAFGELLHETFGLTGAETEVVHGLTLGLPLREIAALRGRSVETVRTQMRSIQQKTETHSQQELLRLVMGLMDLALAPPGMAAVPFGGQLLEALAPRSLTLPDGRRLDWIEFGAPDGAAVLHLHGEFGLARWAPDAELAARDRGLRVIVPIRAGYGRSDPSPEGMSVAEASALDIAALAEHLRIGRAAVLALGCDLAAACRLARMRPGLVSGILACAADLPAGPSAHWPRFLDETARLEPEALALLVQAAFVLARRRGKEGLVLAACGGSSADRLALRLEGIREAVVFGSDICVGPEVSAHAAFFRGRLEAGRPLPPHPPHVPVLFLQGALDPLAPPANVRSFAAAIPGAQVEVLRGSARLLIFEQWETVLDRLCGFIAR
ncbi:alpha/beta fold hydrolase [Rhodobacter sp. NSM]|uniref:alpha/beta fold hydrolase n=1 Tax=Rhodobacter sp. NSM TaxID=3457501 RepID=UPI003FD4D5F0